MSIEDIKALAALGATEVTIKPDGTVVAKFDKPATTQFVPLPYPYSAPAASPWPWRQTVVWGSADNQLSGQQSQSYEQFVAGGYMGQ